MARKDISNVLQNWPFDPDILNVRRIVGDDAEEKIQLRLDLGLLQMEALGRPDGTKPNGFENYFEFYQSELQVYRDAGEAKDFILSPDDLRNLQQESIQYYHRYLCFSELGDYNGVIRDTAHNLEVLEFVEAFAPDEDAAWAFLQYFPYIMMMHTQAKVQISLEDENFADALKMIDRGIEHIREFDRKWDVEVSDGSAREISMLKKWRKTVLEKKPLSKSEKLKADLEEAVRLERYEEAARLRDQLEALQNQD